MPFRRNNKAIDYRNLKGQAAIEYLLTYGWVMVVLLFALAIVAFSTSNLSGAVREECIFPQQVLCTGASLVDGTPNSATLNDIDSVKLNITNNFGNPILLREVSVRYKEMGDVPAKKTYNPPQYLDDGQSMLIEVSTKGLEAGKKYNVRVVVSYSPCGITDQTSCLDDILNITGYVYAEAV